MKKCVADGCENGVIGNGLCPKHYYRQRRYGSVAPGPKAHGSLSERLWRQIDKRGPDECWPWKAKSKIAGYGVIGRDVSDGGKILAHRAVWIEVNGPLPNFPGHHGAVVMHTCDNRLCCNPSHLVVGTQGQNVVDMDLKGRRRNAQLAGERHPNAKFTDEQVRAIRADSRNNAEVAKDYGVPRQTIRYVRKCGWKAIK